MIRRIEDMYSKEKFDKVAEELGMKFVPAVYDSNGKRVYAILPDGTYSYEDPRFNLSYFDKEKNKSKDA